MKVGVDINIDTLLLMFNISKINVNTANYQQTGA